MSPFTRAPFQEAAVDHIVARLTDPRGSRRMLLADEVGLGKTVVARGVIERLLGGRRRSLTVIYVCSNAEIAEQNRRKLDPNSQRPIGRITELAIKRPANDDLVLYSFTPGTSLKDGTGLEWERRLLVYLLHRLYRFPVWRHAWREFFRCGVRPEHWDQNISRRRLRMDFKRKVSGSLQATLAQAWRRQDWDGADLITATERAVHALDLSKADDRSKRNLLIARLRGVMQRAVLKNLEPDLVVLDEVQRFRDVLDQANDPEQIAAELFARRTPVLILSATPYRALTLGHEVTAGVASHHEDFIRTLGFLFDTDTQTPQRIQVRLRAMGERLQRSDVASALDSELLDLKRSVEDDLRKVICRTERNWYLLDRRKGIEEVTAATATPLPGREELTEYFRLHHALAKYGAGQVTEFWKSAPSLLTFLDSHYALLRKLKDEHVRVPKALLTPPTEVTSLARRNHRIGRVISVALGPPDAAPRLWVAPTYTYYRDELYGADRPRKLLVFSGWRFVPKTAAIVTSRVALDRLGSEIDEHTQPLRFSERKSFHTFDVCFPSPLLAAAGADAYRAILHTQTVTDARTVVARTAARLREIVRELGGEVVDHGGDAAWRIVLGAERAAARAARSDVNLADAIRAWRKVATAGQSAEHVAQHAEWALEWLTEDRPLRVSEARLERLAFIAAWSPANCLLRALRSVYSDSDLNAGYADLVQLCLGPLRRYFNRPHVQQVIRTHQSKVFPMRAGGDDHGYAQRVLAYAADGHLQATLDEYAYLLRHAAPPARRCGPRDEAPGMAGALEQLERVWGLVPGKPRANRARGLGRTVTIEADAEQHTSHFALAFGEDVSRAIDPDAEDAEVRKTAVREAFNSPFWPFVLATTSAGQEGLDFHLYCRDILHWNLPSNPVDLEQREGRINRRDCLAIRESIARDWRLADPRTWGGREPARNPWPVVFDSIAAGDDVQKYKHGLFPHWIYECRNAAETVRIQRHVPVFSTSRDAAKYDSLKTGLALYRLVFGQANQEDLLGNLQQQVQAFPPREQDRTLRRLATYMLNLSPIGPAHALRQARTEAVELLDGPAAKLDALLTDVERLQAEGHAELAVVDAALTGMIAFVRAWRGRGQAVTPAVRKTVTALAYLRNPYDRIFDLQVEGGFVDDVAVVSRAWTALQAAAARR